MLTEKLYILQIVRRYGSVGGMERYVWELSKELALLGHDVTVLCEERCSDHAPLGVQVIALGGIRPKPRWLAHLRFSKRVSDWLAAHPDHNRIIHSHERSSVHHITTFHGPPFAKVKEKPCWKRISPRIAANLYLEKRELYSPKVQAIVPNSSLIKQALAQYYPAATHLLTTPITPGVGVVPVRPDRQVQTDAGVIGFVGKEWKRKGLDIAVQIVAELRRQRPNLEFIVVGPQPADITPLFNGWNGGYQLLGETDSTPLYAQFDLLLHPARQEPYGMVIAEARAAGVAVLISDACGIADEIDQSAVLGIDAPTSDWVKACQQQIGQTSDSSPRSWQDVALDQVCCYKKIQL